MLDKPVLRGQRVVLRPLTTEDAEAVLASRRDAEAVALTGTQRTFSPDTLEEVRVHCARVTVADDRLDYAITLTGDPRYRGAVVLSGIDWTNGSADFCTAVGAESRGLGYGSEAAELLLAHAFNRLGLHRLAAEFDFNPRAQHLLRKLGFVQEGVLRDVLLREGAYHSAIKMGLLAPDYRARQARAPFQTLEAERVVLRRLRDDDLGALVGYRRLPEVAWMQLWEGYDAEAGRELIRACRVAEPFTAGGWFQFGVALKETDDLIGDLYLSVDAAGKQAELGYTFAPAYGGRGLATEAVRALLEHAFKERGLHRVYGTTDPRNTPSIKLMKRVGMRQEAHHRENLWFKGAWADDVVFAILAREWRALEERRRAAP